MVKNRISFILILCGLILQLSNCKNDNKKQPVVTNNSSKIQISSKSGRSNDTFSKDSTTQSRFSEEIEGTYNVVSNADDAEKCQIKITIKKVSEQYRYIFTSESRTLEGKLSLEGDKNNEGYYITLEGIEWSEYEGELDDNGEAKSKEDLKLPVGIHGVIKGNEITIQNYGNSMNYYVQLADCGEKYIILKKG